MTCIPACLHATLFAAMLAGSPICPGAEEVPGDRPVTAGELYSRSFVDQSQIISRFTTEQYAHQSSLRIVKGMGYVAYQCNDHSPDENQPGQVARLAIFNILAPAATARWLDIAGPAEASNGITTNGRFAGAPMLHTIGEETLRCFFVTREEGDTASASRLYYKDYDIATGTFSGLHRVRCTVAQKPGEILDLTMTAVQRHLDFLFGPGTGAAYAKGISSACDYVEIDGQLYSTIQIKNSAEGRTLLLANVLMRSADQGATWELLGAPDPRLLPGEIKILAEPAISWDKDTIYLHLRSNVVENGYVLSRASKADLFTFDAPVKKWGFGIGRPTVCDFGPPIGLVGMFTAPTVSMGGNGVSRNKCDVVLIDKRCETFRLAFSIVDFNAVNTPFMHLYRDEVYVSYSTGKRRLIPKFGTSEVVFSKLRREFFVDTKGR